MLKELSVDVTDGGLTMEADTEAGTLTGDVVNIDEPDLEKKVQDYNYLTYETAWQEYATYDIGDTVPFELTATLHKDVTSYRKYHITFTDEMDDVR